MLSQAEMMRMGIALGICFAAYKFINHPAAKAAALGVGGVIVARKVPYLQDALN